MASAQRSTIKHERRDQLSGGVESGSPRSKHTSLRRHCTWYIANEYPDSNKQRYQTASQRFRIPYWDWALNADLPDVVFKQKQVTLNTPQGSKTINNPLYSYTFHPMYSDFGDGLPDEKMWENWRSTYRWPTNTTQNAVSNDDAMEKNLDNNRLTLRDRTYNLLTQATSYEAFSNDGFMGLQTDPAFYDSLESIHGQVHGMTGRNGHMGVVDFAAFDPVFYMIVMRSQEDNQGQEPEE